MTTIYIKEGTKLPARAERDLYVTEVTLIAEALKKYSRGAPQVLDVGAGDGRWGMATSYIYGAGNVDLIDIHAQKFIFLPRLGTSFNYYVEDFLTWKPPHEYDLIVSNPPYSLAEKIIRKSWDLLLPGGRMVFLLRLAFMAGVGRYEELWKRLYPSTVAVCSRRPSFYGGGTNGTDFGIFVWEKRLDENPHGYQRRWTTELLLHERGNTTDVSQEEFERICSHA